MSHIICVRILLFCNAKQKQSNKTQTLAQIKILHLFIFCKTFNLNIVHSFFPEKIKLEMLKHAIVIVVYVLKTIKGSFCKIINNQSFDESKPFFSEL